MALVEEHVTSAAVGLPLPLIVTPLTEPPEGASPKQYDKWDRTCDCCGRHCPWPRDFYTGHVQRNTKTGLLVIISFGVCKEHRV